MLWFLAVEHLLGLGIGLGAVWARWTKMALLGLILALEIRPMLRFGLWRGHLGRQQPVDTTIAPAFGWVRNSVGRSAPVDSSRKR